MTENVVHEAAPSPVQSFSPTSALKADVWRLYGGYSAKLLVKAVVTKPFFRPLLTHRLFHATAALPGWLSGPCRGVLKLMHRGMTARRCMQLPLTCRIGPGLLLKHSYGLIVNGNAVIGANVTLLHHITIGGSRNGVPELLDGSTVAAGAIIIGGIKIGRGSTVGAAAMVTKSVPDRAIVAGNPASVIGEDKAARTPYPAPLEWIGK